jgi:glycolate oxidase FAD binding subunit
MSDILSPTSADQVLEALQWASAENKSLNVIGQGSRSRLGRVAPFDHDLDLSALSGIEEYSPGELVLTVKAATRLSEIEETLAGENQELSFEPPDFGPLHGNAAGQGSIGGLIACNLAGSRRIKAGSARDHFLGFNAISGRAEQFKSGGKVVKNVTGFDLSKLIAGSYGTLAVMTELTVKVQPKPEKIRTVLVCWAIDGIYDHGGVRSMTDALTSAHEVSGAAYIPAKVAELSSVDYVRSAGGSITAIRVEGPGPSVEHRVEELKKLLKKYGKVEELHTNNSITFWKEVRDVSFLSANQDRAIWRLSVPPAKGSQVALSILEGHPGEVIYDWGGGLVWLAVDEKNNADEARVRLAVNAVGGHATLFRASEELRRNIAVFHPQPEDLADISKNIKDGFDPGGILNPGRMYEGI